MHIPPETTWWPALLRSAAALAGLLAVWTGCGLVNVPLHLGGPMNLSFSGPVGVPLVALGILGVALAPERVRHLALVLSAVLAVAAAGPNFWHDIPINDGAFQSLRSGVPSPDTWPASPFLHAVAFAPAGAALAAVRAGPQRMLPLAWWSVLATVASGIGLETFAGALTGDGPAAALVVPGVPVAALFALSGAFGRRAAPRAAAGQAAVLLVLCGLLWVEYRTAV